LLLSAFKEFHHIISPIIIKPPTLIGLAIYNYDPSPFEDVDVHCIQLIFKINSHFFGFVKSVSETNKFDLAVIFEVASVNLKLFHNVLLVLLDGYIIKQVVTQMQQKSSNKIKRFKKRSLKKRYNFIWRSSPTAIDLARFPLAWGLLTKVVIKEIAQFHPKDIGEKRKHFPTGRDTLLLPSPNGHLPDPDGFA
jgi:hypothetical protein